MMNRCIWRLAIYIIKYRTWCAILIWRWARRIARWLADSGGSVSKSAAFIRFAVTGRFAAIRCRIAGPFGYIGLRIAMLAACRVATGRAFAAIPRADPALAGSAVTITPAIRIAPAAIRYGTATSPRLHGASGAVGHVPRRILRHTAIATRDEIIGSLSA